MAVEADAGVQGNGQLVLKSNRQIVRVQTVLKSNRQIIRVQTVSFIKNAPQIQALFSWY